MDFYPRRVPAPRSKDGQLVGMHTIIRTIVTGSEILVLGNTVSSQTEPFIFSGPSQEHRHCQGAFTGALSDAIYPIFATVSKTKDCLRKGHQVMVSLVSSGMVNMNRVSILSSVNEGSYDRSTVPAVGNKSLRSRHSGSE
jgi:hypothetical protein